MCLESDMLLILVASGRSKLNIAKVVIIIVIPIAATVVTMITIRKY